MTRPRRIGMGMKPRDGVLPTTEGQPEPSKEGNLEDVAVVEEGGALEPAATQTPTSPQHEEEKTASVVAGNEFLASPATIKPSIWDRIDSLNGVPKASEEKEVDEEKAADVDDVNISNAPPFFPWPGRNDPEEGGEFTYTSKQNEYAAALEAAETDALAEKMLPEFIDGVRDLTPSIASIEAALNEGCKVDLAPDGKVTFTRPTFLGLLENGELRHTVRIAESYVEGAKQQAEADNMNLEDWLTLQLNTYLEQWWFANGPR